MRRSPLTALVCVLMVLLLLAGCAQDEGRRTKRRDDPLPALSEDEPVLPWDPEEPEPAEETTGPEGEEPRVEPGSDEPTAEQPLPTDPLAPTEPFAPPEPTDSPWPTDRLEPTEPAEPPTDPDAPDVEEPPADVLKKLLEEKLSGLPGTWSIYVKNVDTGETACVNDTPMVAASLIKLYVAGAYYDTDPAAADAFRCSQVDSMINVSSNESCNALINLLGMEQINAFIRSRGDTDSVLNRKMLEQNGKENYITTRAGGLILEQILQGTYVSPAASERLLKNLKDQSRTGKIPAGVPRGVQTANKTGELSNTENDAAIVWSPGGTYILCVMSTDLGNTASARQSIIEISKLVYEYFNAG